MGGEGKRNRNNDAGGGGKKRRRYLPHNKTVKKKGSYPLHPGVEGFFITCDGGREFQASSEALNILDSFFEELAHAGNSSIKQLPSKPLNKKITFADSDSSSSDDEEEENKVEQNEGEKENKVEQNEGEKDNMVEQNEVEKGNMVEQNEGKKENEVEQNEGENGNMVEQKEGEKDNMVEQNEGENDNMVEQNEGEKENKVEQIEGEKDNMVEQNEGEKENKVELNEGEKECKVEHNEGKEENMVEENKVEQNEGEKESKVEHNEGKEQKLDVRSADNHDEAGLSEKSDAHKIDDKNAHESSKADDNKGVIDSDNTIVKTADELPDMKPCYKTDAPTCGLKDKMEEKSIDKLIEEELKELGDKTKRRFIKLDSGCNGVVFIQMRKKDGENGPKDIAEHIVTSAAATRKHMSRFILRILPIEATCYASKEEISKAMQPLVERYFPLETQNPQKFAVMYEARANTGINKMEIIDAVAKSIPGPHKVNLNHPDKTIVVEIARTVCMIGVIDKYKELNKYNLRQLTSRKG